MSAATASPQGRFMRRIWASLPDGQLSERALEEAILASAGNSHSNDFAWASAIRSMLSTAHVVTVRAGDTPRELTYERAEMFPELPVGDNGPGSPSFNAELASRHEEDLRRLDAERVAAFESSPFGVQHRLILDLIDRRVDERIGELLRSVDSDQVMRMRERLAASGRNLNDTAGNGGPEGDTDE